MNNIDKLEERIKFKIAISKIDDEENNIAMNKNIKFKNKKIGIAACACLVLTTGVVFAKDFENYIKKIFNNSTEAIDTAVENGYVQNENMDYVYDKDIGIKVDNLILDDLNLDISFTFETKKENIKSIRFDNFTITNDNNKVIYRSEFKYAETLDEVPLYNSLTWFNSPTKVTDTTFTDSILFGLRPEIEDFKELYFDIKSLKIIYNDDTQEIIDGNWKFSVTINDEMRKNTNISYTLSEKNEYVKSCNATLSATGLILELELTTPFDASEYILENIDKLDDVSLFYLKNNNDLLPASRIDIVSGNTKYIAYYDNIGIFSDNIDSLEIYLEPFDATITLVK